jgi:hypothetical protein
LDGQQRSRSAIHHLIRAAADADTFDQPPSSGPLNKPPHPPSQPATTNTLKTLLELDGNNARGAAADWTPDGTGITMPLTRAEDGHGQRLTAIGTWNITGGLRSTVAISYDADVEAADLFFSPDRSLLAVTNANGVTVFDTRTGALSHTVTTQGNLVGWRDDGHLLVAAPGHELQVVSLAGAVVKTVPLEEVNPQRYRIGSVAGLPATAVTF